MARQELSGQRAAAGFRLVFRRLMSLAEPLAEGERFQARITAHREKNRHADL